MQDAGFERPSSLRGERKTFKRFIGRYSRVALFYLLAPVALMYVYMSYAAIMNGGVIPDSFYEAILENGVPMIASALLALAVAMRFRGQARLVNDAVRRSQHMDGGSFLRLLVFFFGMQGAFQLLTVLAEFALNRFGLTLLPALESSSGPHQGFSMILYVTIFAPVVEELVFRGALMRSLEPFGKLFAIFVSALTFGLMHGNAAQIPFAVATGLLLGYVAQMYSLKWSVALHVLNNLLLSEWLSGMSDFVVVLVIYGTFAGAIVIFVRNRAKIRAFIGANRTQGPWYRWTFSSAWMLALILLCLGSAALGIGRL